MNFIEIKGVSKRYGSSDTMVQALEDIVLSIQKGKFVAIVGASGSGKSTLLHMIGGIDKPTSGEIWIDGVPLNRLSEKEISLFRLRTIGFVFQFFNLIPILTVEENIEMPVMLDQGIIDETYKNELITILGLQNQLHKLPSELSGGQQQRVAIARALMNKPSLLLADEPTGNLDSKSARDTIQLMKYCAKKYHQTLIVITHDERIAQLADVIITIRDGRIIESEEYEE